MDRLRQKTAGTYTLTVVATDEDGVAVTPAAPVTLALADGEGTAIDTYTGTAAYGSITAAVPVTDMAELDTYTGVWTDADGEEWTSHHELCGGFLVELSELRDSIPTLANDDKYTADRLKAARTAAEIRFESACRCAFVPRANRVRLVGDGTCRLVLPHAALREVRSLTVDDGDTVTTWTAAEIADLTLREWGALDYATGSTWTKGYVIEVCYEHGYDFPPEPVREAIKLLTELYLTRSALASRAVTEVSEVGTFALSVAGYRKPTGIPEVDRAIQDFGRVGIMVG